MVGQKYSYNNQTGKETEKSLSSFSVMFPCVNCLTYVQELEIAHQKIFIDYVILFYHSTSGPTLVSSVLYYLTRLLATVSLPYHSIIEPYLSGQPSCWQIPLPHIVRWIPFLSNILIGKQKSKPYHQQKVCKQLLTFIIIIINC